MLTGFVAFGTFWGAWGATLPALRVQSGVTDTQLGIVLLLIAVGALPSMRVTGHLVDRLGPRTVPGVVLALAAGGVLAGASVSPAMLAVTVLMMGAGSGAFDVVINAAVAGALTGLARGLGPASAFRRS